MAAVPLVILDDTSSNFQYSNGQWQASKSPYFYGGTALSLNAGPGTSTGNATFNIRFEGVAIALYGTSPSPLGSESISVSIDGGQTIITTSVGLPSSSYRQLYQSPILSDGSHNIAVGLNIGATLDFAAITPSPHTSLQGQKLVVDDDYNGIQYLGGWRRSLKDVVSNVDPGSPFHNGTHQTWNAGDSLSFSFTGTFVAVYGIFDWANLGSLSATFTLDGSPKSDLYTVNSSSPEFVNGVGQILNFPYYSSGTIAHGKHTLLVNITHCVNQSFILDYITFNPSFDTISQMPNYTTVSTTTAPIDPVHTDGVGPTATSVNDQDKKSSSSTGAVIGGSIGGLLFIALGCALLYLLRRRTLMNVRRSSEHDVFEDPSRPLMQNSLPRSIPLRPPSSLSHRSVSPYPYFTPVTPRQPVSAEELKQAAQEQRRSRRMSSPQIPTNANVPIDDIDSSELASAGLSFTPPHIPDSSGFSSRRPTVNLDDLSSQRALHTITRTSVNNNSSNPMTSPHLGRRTRSATDPSTYSPHLAGPFVALRMTPIRRGFSEPQPPTGRLSTFPGDHNSSHPSPTLSGPVIDLQDARSSGRVQSIRPMPPTTHANPSVTHSATLTNEIHISRSPVAASNPASSLRSSARLSPLRRQVQIEDLLSGSPATTRRSSPIAAAFPRLSAIFLRPQSRITAHNAQEEGDDENNWDGLSLAPPAYESLSPRRNRDGNPSRPGSRPLPVPQSELT